MRDPVAESVLMLPSSSSANDRRDSYRERMHELSKYVRGPFRWSLWHPTGVVVNLINIRKWKLKVPSLGYGEKANHQRPRFVGIKYRAYFHWRPLRCRFDGRRSVLVLSLFCLIFIGFSLLHSGLADKVQTSESNESRMVGWDASWFAMSALCPRHFYLGTRTFRIRDLGSWRRNNMASK